MGLVEKGQWCSFRHQRIKFRLNGGVWWWAGREDSPN